MTSNPITDFAEELQALLNKYNMENTSQTPDEILARYLMGCVMVFDSAVQQRDTWHGFMPGLDRICGEKKSER